MDNKKPSTRNSMKFLQMREQNKQKKISGQLSESCNDSLNESIKALGALWKNHQHHDSDSLSPSPVFDQRAQVARSNTHKTTSQRILSKMIQAKETQKVPSTIYEESTPISRKRAQTAYGPNRNLKVKQKDPFSSKKIKLAKGPKQSWSNTHIKTSKRAEKRDFDVPLSKKKSKKSTPRKCNTIKPSKREIQRPKASPPNISGGVYQNEGSIQPQKAMADMLKSEFNHPKSTQKHPLERSRDYKEEEKVVASVQHKKKYADRVNSLKNKLGRLKKQVNILSNNFDVVKDLARSIAVDPEAKTHNSIFEKDVREAISQLVNVISRQQVYLEKDQQYKAGR